MAPGVGARGDSIMPVMAISRKREEGAMTIQDVATQLDQLSRTEKAQVFQRLALDLAQSWPGV